MPPFVTCYGTLSKFKAGNVREVVSFSKDFGENCVTFGYNFVVFRLFPIYFMKNILTNFVDLSVMRA